MRVVLVFVFLSVSIALHRIASYRIARSQFSSSTVTDFF